MHGVHVVRVRFSALRPKRDGTERALSSKLLQRFGDAHKTMERDLKARAQLLLEEHIQNQNLIRHNLATGALMRALARRFKEEQSADIWELAGLLHDLDWEKTQNDVVSHTRLAAEVLEKENFPREVVEAIRRHNSRAGNPPPETLMEEALFYSEEITGLVVAAALVRPDKKLSGVTAESVMKRFEERSFARGVDRNLLRQVPEKLGIPLQELASIALSAMQEIHEELGL